MPPVKRNSAFLTGALIVERDLQAFIQEGQLAEALGERVETVDRLLEDGGIGVKRDFRAGLLRLAEALSFDVGVPFS